MGGRLKEKKKGGQGERARKKGREGTDEGGTYVPIEGGARVGGRGEKA
jgi:hypothetical protein